MRKNNTNYLIHIIIKKHIEFLPKQENMNEFNSIFSKNTCFDSESSFYRWSSTLDVSQILDKEKVRNYTKKLKKQELRT